MQEANEPLDYEAFVRLMSRRTQELDPEDVLLEAWSKWDDHGTGKIDERKWVTQLEWDRIGFRKTKSFNP